MLRNDDHGFTLLELAIVLVILGLLVGGVLVGQDLIKAAQVRATVVQMEKYDAAAIAFRTKYNGLPGDVSNPANFGLASTGATGAIGLADSNNLFYPGACSNPYGLGGETALFWTHLTQANLIDRATMALTDYGAVAAITITDSYLPPALIGRGNSFHVITHGGLNYYVLANITATTANTCAISASDALTPLEAFMIDSKIDDGAPATGIVISVLDAGSPTGAGGGSAAPDAVGTDDCYNSTTAPGAYAINTSALASAIQCQLRIRPSF